MAYSIVAVNNSFIKVYLTWRLLDAVATLSFSLYFALLHDLSSPCKSVKRGTLTSNVTMQSLRRRPLYLHEIKDYFTFSPKAPVTIPSYFSKRRCRPITMSTSTLCAYPPVYMPFQDLCFWFRSINLLGIVSIVTYRPTLST